MKNPFGGQVNPAKVAKMMQSQDALSSLLESELPGLGASPAAVFADIVNVHRADMKMLAQEAGVETDISHMSEQEAAELLSGVTNGDAVDLLVVFNDLASQRDKVLRERLSEREYQQFMAQKTAEMNVDNPTTFEEE